MKDEKLLESLESDNDQWFEHPIHDEYNDNCSTCYSERKEQKAIEDAEALGDFQRGN